MSSDPDVGKSRAHRDLLLNIQSDVQNCWEESEVFQADPGSKLPYPGEKFFGIALQFFLYRVILQIVGLADVITFSRGCSAYGCCMCFWSSCHWHAASPLYIVVVHQAQSVPASTYQSMSLRRQPKHEEKFRHRSVLDAPATGQ